MLAQNGQGPGKWVGNDVGKEDSGVCVAPVPFESPAEAVRELQLCGHGTEPQGAGDVRVCAPAMTCACFQFLFQASCHC